jgi:threonylcarbamoyladenosine tRNA methylthiotransferase MtaB
MKTFFIRTLGCKVNQYESQSIREALIRDGFIPALSESEADWVVINSCAVTSASMSKSRQAVRRAKKENPSVRVAVLGCGIDAEPGDFSGLDGVVFQASNKDKGKVVDFIKRTECPDENIDVEKNGFKAVGVSGLSGHTRAFLKVQDGCNRFCSYCIVPYLRGMPFSRPVNDIVLEAKRLVESGVMEIVLTGVNLGLYGNESGNEKSALVSLVDQLRRVSHPGRLRLSSLNCLDVTDELLDIIASDGVCPHLHLSLQSGSEAVLKAMNRGYNHEKYLDVVTKAQKKIKDLAVTTDVIVGFPGESDRDFEDTLKIMRMAHVSRTHVFTFSPRKGTAAAKMHGVLNDKLLKERSKQARDVAKQLAFEYKKQFEGRVLPVLVMEEDRGLSHNYIELNLEKAEPYKGRIVSVEIVDVDKKSCKGSIKIT